VIPSINVRAASKCFHIYERPIDRLLQGVYGRSRTLYREFWALRDVDLEVWPGETVGIVGKNGSGKSTLLQIIAGTMTPTQGDVEVHGRVAALLELGSGFSPDFTGRENVKLNASLLGLRAAEIEERMPRIEAFAELEDFIDQPVRTYSSGMYMRLAFAVAINTDPDVLIIDEALAVGDEAFQRKCFATIERMKKGGATILFVSHSASSVNQLCDRAVLLDGGRRLLTSTPRSVVSRYQRLLYAPAHRRDELLAEIRSFDAAASIAHGAEQAVRGVIAEDQDEGESAPVIPPIESADHADGERYDPGFVSKSRIEYPSRGARIFDPHLRNRDGERVNILISGEEYVYTYEVEFLEPVEHVRFGMMLRSVSGVDLFGMSSHTEVDGIERLAAGERCRVEFRMRTRLLPGTYFLNAGCQGIEGSSHLDFLHRILDATVFRIELAATNRRMYGFYDLSREPACQWRRLSPAVHEA
jgi:lipopolysaccharide transport system ATP-binding protein